MRKFLFILIPLFFFACKKDRLTDGKEILIGKWEWVYNTKTYHVNKYIDSVYYFSDSTAFIGVNDIPDEYSLEFKKRGKVVFYKNNKKIESKRIVFQAWTNSSAFSFYNSPNNRFFQIYLDNNQENYIMGNVSQDTLILYPFYFPDIFSNVCEKCVSINNYFIRE